jgi:hypothetical protein
MLCGVPHADRGMPISAGPTPLRAGGKGDGALTKLNFATGIVKQLHECVRSPSCRRRVRERVVAASWAASQARVALDWPMRARGPCSTHNNMHSNATSRDCNGIGDCKRERTFGAQGVPCKACLPTRRFAGKAFGCHVRHGNSVLTRHALLQGCGRVCPSGLECQ